MQEEAHTPRPIPWGWLAALVAISALVRLLVRGMTPVIGADGPTFLRIAGQIAGGDLRGALSHDYHPLYPAGVALASRIVPDLEIAATSVSFLFGILMPLPLFLLARRALGDRVGLGAGLLVAFHPVAARLAVDQKSDALYAFLFVTAIGILWEGIRSRRALLLGAGGLVAGMAYLARPEGLGVVLVALAWLLLSRREGWRRKALLVGCLLLGTAIPAAPYVAAISDAGAFRITRKKGISDFIGSTPRIGRPTGLCLMPPAVLAGEGSPTRRLRYHGDEMGPIQRVGWASVEVIQEVVKTTHPAILLFLLLGVIRLRALPRRRDQEAFVLSNLALHGIVLFLLVLGVHYLSRRHVFPLAILVLPWAAAGITEAVAYLKGRDRLAILLYGGLILLLSAKTFYPDRLEQIAQREVGIWIRTVSGGKVTHVLTPQEKVAYYAGATWVPFAPQYGATLDIGRHHGTRYVVFIREKVDQVCPGFLQAIREEDLGKRFSLPIIAEAPFRQPRRMHIDVYEMKAGTSTK